MTPVAPAATGAGNLARSTAAMTAITLISRLTGFGRVLVAGAVLGDVYLGDTYQTANTMPNLLFELFAAGVLAAVLIPSIVEMLDRGNEEEANHVARSVLGLAGAGLAVLAGLAALAAPWIMELLVGDEAPASVRSDQVRLGTILLWFFLPQVVLYAAGMVATGVLNARGRFVLPVFAPAVNNVVVTASYGLFWYLTDSEPTLDLTPVQVLVLGGGTTLGVLAFCGVPVVAVVRSGFSLLPRFDHRHHQVRRIARLGFWAAMLIAGTQLLMLVVLLLANDSGIPGGGGVVAYQLAFTFFLLPHALFALPVLTAMFPTLTRHAASGDHAAYQGAVEAGVRVIAYLVLGATAVFLALSGPITEAFLFGRIRDPGQVADVMVALAPGLLGYGTFLFLARAFYARGDARTPAFVGLGVVGFGTTVMVASSFLVERGTLITALGASHSFAYLLGATGLFVLLRRRMPVGSSWPVVVSVSTGSAAAGFSWGAMWATQWALDLDGRVGALVVLLVAGAVGLATYAAAQALIGRTSPSAVADLLRGS